MVPVIKKPLLGKTFADKRLYVKGMVSPVVVYACESWAIKKAEH